MVIFVKGSPKSKTVVNIGKIMTVGKFIGKKPGFRGIMWEVDQLVMYLTGEYFLFAPEHSLERIDDDEVPQRIVTEKSITA